MSDSSRQRLIRAVRMLPGTAKIGVFPPQEEPQENAQREQEHKRGESSLVSAVVLPDPRDARIKQLLSDLEAAKTQIVQAEQKAADAHKQLQEQQAALQEERRLFHEKAQAEAESALQEAKLQGHREGVQTGLVEGTRNAEEQQRALYKERFATQVSLLENIHGELIAQKELLVETQLPQLLSLWEIMLERMLLARVQLDPTVADRTVRDIIRRISDREKILVYLNPEDLPLVTESRDELLDSLRGIQHFEFLSDAHVDRGSCLVETGMGIYDARWRTQLEQIDLQVQQLLMEVELNVEPETAKNELSHSSEEPTGDSAS